MWLSGVEGWERSKPEDFNTAWNRRGRRSRWTSSKRLVMYWTANGRFVIPRLIIFPERQSCSASASALESYGILTWSTLLFRWQVRGFTLSSLSSMSSGVNSRKLIGWKSKGWGSCSQWSRVNHDTLSLATLRAVGTNVKDVSPFLIRSLYRTRESPCFSSKSIPAALPTFCRR